MRFALIVLIYLAWMLSANAQQPLSPQKSAATLSRVTRTVPLTWSCCFMMLRTRAELSLQSPCSANYLHRDSCSTRTGISLTFQTGSGAEGRAD